MRVGRLEAQLDLYQILGVSPRSTPAEIRRAHKRLVRLHHPDRSWQHQGPHPSDEQMKRINHAASVLLDEAARADYDHLRRNPGASPRPAPRPEAPSAPAWYDAPPSAPTSGATPASPSWYEALFRVAMAPRGRAPIPPALFAVALLVPFVLALVAPALGGPTPVSSPDYRIPRAPQRVTLWARLRGYPQAPWPRLWTNGAFQGKMARVPKLPIPEVLFGAPPELFLGRQEELQAISQALEAGTRIIFLTGSPGVGKSLLAKKAAEELSQRRNLPYRLSSLENLDDEEEFLERICEIFSCSSKNRDHLEMALSTSQYLIILDDVDHLVEPCLRFLKNHAISGECCWLVTSRERLSLPGAFVLEVGPLPEAEELFFFHANQVSHLSEPRESLYPYVQALVERLDRIPLAVEIAANQIAWLSPQDMLERIKDILHFPVNGGEGQGKSIPKVLQLSWDLCSEEEKKALATLSVFPADFSLAAAEEVLCRAEVIQASDSKQRKAMMLLASLCKRSMLNRSVQGGRTRFRMLFLVKTWVEEFRLRWSLLANAVQGWVSHYRDLALDFFQKRSICVSREMLSLEKENFYAILRGRSFLEGAWMASTEDKLLAICALEDWPSGDGLPARDTSLVAKVLAECTDREAPWFRGKTLRIHALQLCCQGRYEEALSKLDLAVPLLESLEFMELEGEIWLVKAMAFFGLGEQQKTLEASTRARDILLEVGRHDLVGLAWLRMGDVLQAMNKGEEARSIFEQAIAFAEAHQLPIIKARANAALGFYWLEREEHTLSHRAYRQAISVMEEKNRRFALLLKLYDALVFLDEQDPEQALLRLSELGPDQKQELSPSVFCVVAALKALALATLDRLEEAAVQGVLAESRKDLPPWVQHVIQLYLAHVDLARARKEETEGRNPEILLRLRRSVHQLLEDSSRDQEFLDTSDDARIALRLLRRANKLDSPSSLAPPLPLEEATPESETRRATGQETVLDVGEAFQWFRVPGGGKVSLSRRGALRTLFSALCRARLAGRALTGQALIEATWPGELLDRYTARNRLHVTITTLRKLGLREILAREEDRYFLAATLRIVSEEG